MSSSRHSKAEMGRCDCLQRSTTTTFVGSGRKRPCNILQVMRYAGVAPGADYQLAKLRTTLVMSVSSRPRVPGVQDAERGVGVQETHVGRLPRRIGH